MTLPEEYGGAGLSYEDFCYALEEISKSSVSYAVTISVSTMTQAILNAFGNEEQKKKYLPELTSGKAIGAFALSESGSGSDAASLKTTAKKVDGGYILNGTKLWITSGGIAKTYIVMARTGQEGAKGISAFIVEDGMEGFSYGKKENKMGWNISPTRELIFEIALYLKKTYLKKKALALK
ncbi:acyl-CoA dehydrogenase family protein [Bacteriovorax sp. DB6_IX]|uniref:acyl-CoA dehydrogenase family protein n=1 Tax=Bacteriovorax sp. DB6_IX TaxID=1353530 RepID=UPI000389E1E1|nr:acyl-CoA dehydrogenase family protein [Bacteriovorax sp. DB6_IX]EQC52796.1 acyl-CoA dehydrogenase family protein [Bacteriovorax sp. DB6_IX]